MLDRSETNQPQMGVKSPQETRLFGKVGFLSPLEIQTHNKFSNVLYFRSLKYLFYTGDFRNHIA
jgi:hypothetical protein